MKLEKTLKVDVDVYYKLEKLRNEIIQETKEHKSKKELIQDMMQFYTENREKNASAIS